MRYVRHGAQLAWSNTSNWARKKVNRRERLKAKQALRESYWCETHLIDWDFCPGPDGECVKGEWFD